MEWLFWVWASVFGCLGYFVLRIATLIWWRPLQLKRCFESQGIRGPPYRLLNGNFADMDRMDTEAKSTPMPWSHDIVPRVLPYYHHWTKIYGKDFIYWFGSTPRLNVPHPELIKEIMSSKFGHYEIFSSNPLERQLVEQGLVGLKGENWARHRRIINPAFHMDFLKGMVPTVVESTANMLGEWSKMLLAGAEEVEVLKEFCNLTADVISRTAFGNSYAEAKHIFDLQDQQGVLTVELARSVYIPGFRFLPTRKNRQRWKLEKEIRKNVRQVIEVRERTADIDKSGSYGTDLLGVMMSPKTKQAGNKLQDLRMTTEEIIDECKTFYFAGHETTSILLTWTMILLGMHQDWQERGRKEVLEVCGKNVDPDADSVNHLRIVGMILNETLRLYPPVAQLQRHTYKPMKLGSLSIPAGTLLLLPVLAIHHDQDLWGSDANEFNPARFSDGITRNNQTGKTPHSKSKGSILSRDESKPNSSTFPNATAGEKNHNDSNNRKETAKDNIKVASPCSGRPMSGSTVQEKETGHCMLGSHSKPESGSFSVLMEGVVFAISGLVNPERGNLRSQALEMGAEYQPDWNPECTLLVCAFPNTPKFKQVKGDGGTIVSKEWITECYKQKKLVDIDCYLMHAGKPWKKTQSLNVSNESDNVILGEKPKQTKKKLQLEGRSVSARNEKTRNIDAKSSEKSNFSPSDVQKWVVEDLNATASWLQEQEEKPQPSEVEETAMQGIMACLEDATKCLKENKVLRTVLDVWEFVPRVVQQLAAYEDPRRGSQTISREELCKRADTVKSIYETEFKRMRKEAQSKAVKVKGQSDSQPSGVLHRSNKVVSENITDEAIPDDASKGDRDYDSDDTIVMDEDELDQVEEFVSKNNYSKI